MLYGYDRSLTVPEAHNTNIKQVICYWGALANFNSILIFQIPAVDECMPLVGTQMFGRKIEPIKLLAYIQ